MSIIIPSKNIYDIRNPKIRDNIIDSVVINGFEKIPNDEYDIVVANFKIESSSYVSTTDYSSLAKGYDAYQGSNYKLAVGYVQVIAKYLVLDLKIPVLEKNKYVESLILQNSNENGEKIEHIY